MRQAIPTLKLLAVLFLVPVMVFSFLATKSYASLTTSKENAGSLTLALNPSSPKSFLQQGDDTDLQDLDEEDTATINNLPLGWQISAVVHKIIALHREEIENITLVRRIFLNETKTLRLQLINQTHTEIKLAMQNMNQEMERLREEYSSGSITREEYLMQMFRLRLRFREEISKLKTLGKEIQDLNKKISEENKELAKNLAQVNKEFAEQMKKVHEYVKQLINATRPLQKRIENMTRGLGLPNQEEHRERHENRTQGMKPGKP